MKPDLQPFEELIYGTTPAFAQAMHVSEDAPPFDPGWHGLPCRITQPRFEVTADEQDVRPMHVLCVTPLRPRPRAWLVGLNGYGNHTVHADRRIRPNDLPVPPLTHLGVRDRRAGAACRGAHSERFPIERILERGFGFATFCAADLRLDDRAVADDAGSLHAAGVDAARAAGVAPWGAVGAWAWGLAVLARHLAWASASASASASAGAAGVQAEADAAPVWVFGHSRRGKAALWAAARERAIDGVILNNSGCLGAALTRRAEGETIARITTRHGHWFTPGLSRWAGRDAEMPVDQDALMRAAVAGGRHLYVSSAAEDGLADPAGEYAATRSVVASLGAGAWPMEPPPLDQPRVADRVGYHLRSGPHGVTRFDWEAWLDFVDHAYG